MTTKTPKGYHRRLLCLALFAFALTGCSSSDDDDGGTGPAIPVQQSGIFLDSAVENLGFETVTNSGTTDQDGTYTYLDGELITFSIGALEFPVVAASALTTPLTLAGSQSTLDQQTTNIARLLQSLDDDGNPSNGIRIASGAAAAAAPIDFDVDTNGFESNAAVVALVAGAGGVNTTLISEEAAQSHLDDTIANFSSGIVGAWSQTDGTYFNHLALFEDGTFVYGENDILGTDPAENGVEVGTYEYNSISGNVTFTITYDDNAPGTDSGIGDIGTPAVIDVVPAPGGASLSVAGGELVLEAANLASGTGIAGAWRATSGAEFNYLILHATGTFLYAENDLGATDPAENGLEVGTYVYSSETGTISFTITYDDNAPGEDSGVGDIGTLAVFDAQLSNGNNTLTTAAGELVFSRGL